MAVLTTTVGSAVSAVIPYVVPALLTFCLLFVTRQIFLHPLSNFPGPFLAKLSEAYNGFWVAKKSMHLITRANHVKYGSVVRQGPNKLVFSSVSALRDIYKNDRITKVIGYMALGPGLTTQIMFTSTNKDFHRARRQLIGQILTDKSMHTFEPTMIDQVDIFVQQLLDDSKRVSPVNISERTRRLTTDIASLLGFGYDLRLQTHEDNRFLLGIIDKVMPMSSLFYHWFSIRTKIRWISVFFSSEMREKYLGLMEKMVKSRMAQDKDAIHDLYSFVADDLDSGSGSLRQSDLWAECNFFLTAAGETSKSALSATLFYLSRNPGCYKKLADEIRSTFSSGSDIRGATLASCRYLRACIDESLRISPPGPGIFWRERVADDSDSQPLVIDGHVIPPGTVFGLNTYSLHHDETYFPDSFAYIPERWLGTDETTKRANEAFAAFSVGARACAGKPVAYLEMGLVIAKTIWHFDFEAASGPMGDIGAGGPGLGLGRDKPGEFQLYDVFNSCHDGPYLIFKTRGGAGEHMNK